MDNLSLHIEYLLLRHDCVIVPGFGAFINVRSEAFFDNDSRQWMPFTREVRFNRALVHDDGLLSNSYARKYEVSFAEAREILRKDVENLRLLLQADGEVSLGHLGILKDEDGNLVYHPLASPQNHMRMLGYQTASIILKPKTENISSQKHSADIEKENIKTRPIDRKFDTSRNYYIAINKQFAKVAAVFVVIILMAVSIIIPTTDKLHRIDKASVVPYEKVLDKLNKEGVQINKTDNVDIDNINESEKIATETQEKIIPVHTASSNSGGYNPKDYRYHAIVATFNSPEEATKFVDQYEGKDLSLHVISTKTKSRVSASDSDSREQLQQKIMNPEFRKNFSEAWIWED